jgi:hypothetical protein
VQPFNSKDHFFFLEVGFFLIVELTGLKRRNAQIKVFMK